MGRGREGLGFDARTGMAVSDSAGSSDRATESESGFEESSDEEGDATANMKTVDGEPLGELNRLEELIRLAERRTLEE